MSAALASTAATGGHRAITVAALMATYMEAVNISLPNAALPRIQGTLSMANDEVGWVFTAYIAAGAAVMPMARWLAGRYGRKTIYQLSLAVFSLGLMLDTLATSPIQFVFARIVQGAASGTLAPLSLAILLDVLSPARHARISLAWSVCLVLGISGGASIGGWLSEYHGWQSIFYFSLPMTDLIFLTVELLLPEKRAEQNTPFDFFGLAMFSLGMIGLQMLLDRGERVEWFASAETWVEAIASVLGFYLFIVHVMTTDVHFLNKALFKDRNFILSAIMFFAVGFVLLPTLALTSPMLEDLLNYPVDTAGYMTLARGVTLVGAVVLMSFAPARIDNRLFVFGGMALVVYANWLMLGYSPAMDWRLVVAATLLQGTGLGTLLPRSPRPRSARSIRNSARKAPHSSTCRASMAARLASRSSRYSSTTTPRPCTSRKGPHALPRHRSRRGLNRQAGPCRTQRNDHPAGGRRRGHRPVRDPDVRHADREPACASAP
jgi:DHA2 family multidrug resistance protein